MYSSSARFVLSWQMAPPVSACGSGEIAAEAVPPPLRLSEEERLTAVETPGIMSKRNEFSGRRPGMEKGRAMGKRWAAGVLVALPLLWAGLVSPLAWAQERTAKGEEPAAEMREVAEAEGGELTLTEIAGDGGDLAEMRAVPAAGVPERERDAVRWALYRELLSPGEEGDFAGERPVSRGEAVQALYRLSGILFPVDVCPYPDVPEEYQDAAAWASACGISGGVAGGRFLIF